ncbi:MAG TPA: zinc-ribbon domain-containing protein, partial [Anaerolineae bacterium]|nr:zinc-ribbon domain-containing protein [Anaerolineae bacterium]
MAKICPTCGTVNRDDARFCSSCATPLGQELICPSCGTRNVPTARFCHQCATPLAGAISPTGPGTGLLAPKSRLAGRYIIVGKVGEGGMGAVYKATDSRLGHKLVAVKEVSDAELEVDGGIGPQTAERVVAAGATMLVAGKAIFGA